MGRFAHLLLRATACLPFLRQASPVLVGPSFPRPKSIAMVFSRIYWPVIDGPRKSTSTGTAFTIPHTTTIVRGCRAKNHRVEEAEIDPCITLIFFQPLNSSYAPSFAREKCVTACLRPATFKITTLR